VDKVPRIVTIAHLSSANMGYAIITTEDTYMEKAGIFSLFPQTAHYKFNSSWILRVVQHAKGLPLIKDARGSAEYQHQRFEAHSQPGKSRRAYCVGGESSLQFLLQAQIEKTGIIRDPGQAVDLHQLGRTCRRSVGGVRERLFDDYGWNVPQLLIRKRKFKRWIRQNMNRFLFSRSVQEAHEREYQKEMDRMCDDMNDDWDD